MNVTIKTKEAFQGIGVKWCGTYEQAAQGEIRTIQQRFRGNVKYIERAVNPEITIGLSYHNIENGFTLYLVAEVDDISNVPDGMEVISVPSYTFAAMDCIGENIHEDYVRLYNWIKENNYETNQEDLEHLEEYPVSYNPEKDVPTLTIHIPIK